MIKLKKILNESNVWDRKFGEPLPTLRLEHKTFKNKSADTYLQELLKLIRKYLPPKFSVMLTRRTHQISIKYPTKQTHELNDNFDVY